MERDKVYERREDVWKQRLSVKLLYIIYKPLCLKYGLDKMYIILGVLSSVEGDEGELIILNCKLYESLNWWKQRK
jgi:hypothetical protein